MKNYKIFFISLLSLLLLNGCVKVYTNHSFQKQEDTTKAAKFFIKKVFDKYYNNQSAYCSSYDYYPNDKDRLTAKGASNLKREILKYFEKYYLISDSAENSYFGYDRKGKKQSYKTVETKLWLGEGFLTVSLTTSQDWNNKIKISLSIESKNQKQISQPDLRKIASKENFFKILAEKQTFINSLKAANKRRAQWAQRRAENEAYRRSEYNKRTWNAVLKGVNKSLNSVESDLRKQRSNSLVYASGKIPKTWNDMTDKERKEYSDKIEREKAYNKSKYEEYEERTSSSKKKKSESLVFYDYTLTMPNSKGSGNHKTYKIGQVLEDTKRMKKKVYSIINCTVPTIDGEKPILFPIIKATLIQDKITRSPAHHTLDGIKEVIKTNFKNYPGIKCSNL